MSRGNIGVAVTGLGLITPLASGREATWAAVREGKSPLAEEFDGLAWAAPFVNPNGLPKIFHMSLAAAREALADAGADMSGVEPERLGCSVAVSKPVLASGQPLRCFPPEAVPQWLRRTLGFAGPAQNAVAACATGLLSLWTALRWLREGRCDLALAGSADSSLHPLFVAGFRRMGVLDPSPRPFDRRRKGFVMGEGAAILVLERTRDARARGARIYAELASVAAGSDCAHPAAFAADGSSIAAVLRRALAQAGARPETIDYAHLHGTGTALNDAVETRAAQAAFGARAGAVPMSSTKASTGHLLGAAGSLGAAFACLALRDGFAPPTANLEEPDPECDLDYVPLRGRALPLKTAAAWAFGFGGPIGAAVFRKI